MLKGCGTAATLALWRELPPSTQVIERARPFVPSGGQKQRKKTKEFHACAGGCVWGRPSLWRAISALAGRGGKSQEPPKSERLPPKLLDLLFSSLRRKSWRAARWVQREANSAQPRRRQPNFQVVRLGQNPGRRTQRRASTAPAVFWLWRQPKTLTPPSSILAMCARGAQCEQVAHTQRAKGAWNATIGADSRALLTLAGLEPAIFGSEDQRLIH